MISLAKIKDGPFLRSGRDFDLVYTDGGQVMNVVITLMYRSMNLDLIVVLDSGSYLTYFENQVEWTKTDGGNYPEALES